MSAWIKGYVGIPFLPHGRTRLGCDCWGLVRLVLAEQFDTPLPSYTEKYEGTGCAHACSLGDLFDAEWPLPGWIETPGDRARSGDVLLLRRMGGPCHVAVIVGPGLMLHTVPGSNTCVEHYDRTPWTRRIEGVYRHDPAR